MSFCPPRHTLALVSLCVALSACGDDGVTGDAGTTLPTTGPTSGGTTTAGTTGPDAATTTTSATTGFDAGSSSTTRGPLQPGLETRPANTTCLATEAPQPASSLTLERAFPALSFDLPVGMFQAPGDAGHWFVIEQAGDLLRFEDRPDVASADTVLTVNARYDGGNDERGLLGLAFHPDFQSNGYLYLMYVRTVGLRDESVLVRYTSDDGGASFGSPLELLTETQPAPNHNGGALAFGPDGYLYVALGDGGGANDTFSNGQNLDSLLATILRLDVDGGSPYAIPADNPYAGGGGLPEIYAYGLRNPWRIAFDPLTGELWASDVGQGCLEEVDLIERGGNYGWPVLEGDQCFTPGECNGGRACASDAYIDPVTTYGRDLGRSITGGYVYRGTRVPALEGTYLFADFVSGRIWGVARDQGGEFVTRELLDSSANIASFGQGLDGEVYVVDRSGALFAVAPGNDAAVDPLPQKLSETGCVDPADPTQVSEGVLPYDLRVPFWSDGARKDRYFALPDGATLEVDASGDWILPPGAVTMKTFWLGDRRIETRFFVRHPDGTYSGYTYEWNEAQTDADLLDTRKRVQVAGQTWAIPSRGECFECHTRAANFSLGLESRQLDRAIVYPGGSEGNQIVTLDHLGMFATAPQPSDAPLALLDDAAASLDARARAYLHVNCSSCHRPGGPGRGSADLRIGASDLGICDVPPVSDDLGVDEARLLVPGASARSLIALRPGRRDSAAMPPLASLAVDESGTALLREWIDSLQRCP